MNNPQRHDWNWRPPANWTAITTIDMHTGGEPLPVITRGLPPIPAMTAGGAESTMGRMWEEKPEKGRNILQKSAGTGLGVYCLSSNDLQRLTSGREACPRTAKPRFVDSMYPLPSRSLWRRPAAQTR